jgi:hypothetical protein
MTDALQLAVQRRYTGLDPAGVSSRRPTQLPGGSTMSLTSFVHRVRSAAALIGLPAVSLAVSLFIAFAAPSSARAQALGEEEHIYDHYWDSLVSPAHYLEALEQAAALPEDRGDKS